MYIILIQILLQWNLGVFQNSMAHAIVDYKY